MELLQVDYAQQRAALIVPLSAEVRKALSSSP